MGVKSKKVIEGKIEEFLSQPSIRGALAHLIDVFPDGTVIYMAGGAIRNLIIDVFHPVREDYR